MAINYTKIGWDTSKYVNPTNMNQMDNGIKAACDGVDAHDTAIAGKVSKSGDTMTGNLTINVPGSTNTSLIMGHSNATDNTGLLYMWRGSYQMCLYPSSLTGSRYVTLPDASGTIALKEDLTPTALSFTVNSSSIDSAVQFGRKVGYIAVVNAILVAKHSLSGTVELGTLTGTSIPKADVNGICVYYGNALVGYAAISASTGKLTCIFLTTVPQWAYLVMPITYITTF